MTFRTKGDGTETVTPVELLRRFVKHVLPDGFHKIRHVGLHAALEALMQNAPLKIRNPILRKIVDAGRVEGRVEGQAEGEARGKADAVLAVLDARGLAVTVAVAARVRACRDLAELDRWIWRAATVARADDLF